jgi:A/G-specific adenine glycosylase
MSKSERQKRRYESFTPALLKWFRLNRRKFPWRTGKKNAYRIAVAEILLQKTNVEKVVPVFKRLINQYPTAKDVTQSDQSDLSELLRPLGLPRRALLLRQLCQRLESEHNGIFPSSEKELRKLPGIGPYGAGAIASQVFGQPAPMIDINVMRIFHRVFSTTFTPRSGPSKELRELVVELMPLDKPADFNLGLIDFGALICRSRNPQHDICPMASFCDYNLSRKILT